MTYILFWAISCSIFLALFAIFIGHHCVAEYTVWTVQLVHAICVSIHNPHFTILYLYLNPLILETTYKPPFFILAFTFDAADGLVNKPNYHLAKCHYAKYHLAKRNYAKFNYAKCNYAIVLSYYVKRNSKSLTYSISSHGEGLAVTWPAVTGTVVHQFTCNNKLNPHSP